MCFLHFQFCGLTVWAGLSWLVFSDLAGGQLEAAVLGGSPGAGEPGMASFSSCHWCQLRPQGGNLAFLPGGLGARKRASPLHKHSPSLCLHHICYHPSSGHVTAKPSFKIGEAGPTSCWEELQSHTAEGCNREMEEASAIFINNLPQTRRQRDSS